MSPNLRKSQPNLAKPSEGGSFNAGKKPSEKTSPLGRLNLRAESELGSIGGIKATGRLTVGVDQLLGQQGVSVEIDATNRTAGFGAGLGSTKGKLGVNIGGRVGYDENGNVRIKGAEAGINIGGFGGSASIDEDEGIRGSISVAGATVEIGIAPDGKKTVSLCYGVPGGELCVTFEPDPGIELPPIPEPEPEPLPPNPEPDQGIDVPNTNDLFWVPFRYTRLYYDMFGAVSVVATTYTPTISNKEDPANITATKVPFDLSLAVKEYGYNEYTLRIRKNSLIQRDTILTGVWPREEEQQASAGVFKTSRSGLIAGFMDSGININNFLTTHRTNEEAYLRRQRWGFTGDRNTQHYAPTAYVRVGESKKNGLQLPNYPQHFKRMDCCDKVEEIYKILGVAKFKKNKFPVSNAFLVPGGVGNDNCVDYYSIMQALFRMLANGLIINPKSKPLGTEWQNVNATAWASDMYMMLAESMSDGNTTQRFEVAAIMQLVQMTSILAENARKIEFVADAIGLEPLLVSEEVPVCFTIFEGHKGFGKKEPEKIKISGLKTNEQVENALGQMLNPSLIPITTWKFKPGQISINEALRNG